MNLHASFHGERCWTCVFQCCSGFSDYGWWFQTWLDDFPFHIWDVIRKPLTFTHSMIFQDGFYSHHQVFFGSPKKFSRDRQVTWRSLGPWLLTSDFSNIYSSGPTNSYKWDDNSCNSGDISNELTTPARFATDWFSRENLNRKPCFFPWNMGCSCNIFH